MFNILLPTHDKQRYRRVRRPTLLVFLVVRLVSTPSPPDDDARYALRAGLGPPRILEAGASLELLEPLEMREGVHSESVLGGR